MIFFLPVFYLFLGIGYYYVLSMIENNLLDEVRTKSIIGSDFESRVTQRQPLIEAGKKAVRESKGVLAGYLRERLSLEVKQITPRWEDLKTRQQNALVNRKIRELLLVRNRSQIERELQDAPLEVRESLEAYYSQLKAVRKEQRLSYKERTLLALGIDQPHDLSPIFQPATLNESVMIKPRQSSAVEIDISRLDQIKKETEKAWQSYIQAKRDTRSPVKALGRDLQNGWKILWQRQEMEKSDPEEVLAFKKRQFLDRRNDYAALMLNQEFPRTADGGRAWKERLADTVISRVGDLEREFIKREVNFNNSRFIDRFKGWLYDSSHWRIGTVLAAGTGYLIADQAGVAPHLGLMQEVIILGGAVWFNDLLKRFISFHPQDKGEITLEQANKMSEGSRRLKLAQYTENRIGRGKSEPGKGEETLLEAQKRSIRKEILDLLARQDRRVSKDQMRQLIAQSVRKTEGLHPYHELLASEGVGIPFWLYTGSIVSGLFAQRLGFALHF